MLGYFEGGTLHADAVGAVALPAGQQHVPIHEEHHLAIGADVFKDLWHSQNVFALIMQPTIKSFDRV